MRKIRAKIKAGFTSVVGLGLAFSVLAVCLVPNLAFAAEKDIVAQGTQQGCSWVVYEDGAMELGPTRDDAQSANIADIRFISTEANTPEHPITSFKIAEGKKVNAPQMMMSAFANCSELKSVDLDGLNTANTMTFNNMFQGCTKLEEADLSVLDMKFGLTFQYMFEGCTSLKKVNLEGVTPNRLNSCQSMFAYCTSLEELDISSLDFSNTMMASGMFEKCTSLNTLVLPDMTYRNEIGLIFAAAPENILTMIKKDSSENLVSQTTFMSQLIGSDETPELDGTKLEGSWVASHRLTITQEGTSTEYVFEHGVTPDPSTLVTIPQGFQLVGWVTDEGDNISFEDALAQEASIEPVIEKILEPTPEPEPDTDEDLDKDTQQPGDDIDDKDTEDKPVVTPVNPEVPETSDIYSVACLAQAAALSLGFGIIGRKK